MSILTRSAESVIFWALLWTTACLPNEAHQGASAGGASGGANCTPKTCGQVGANCGAIDDGCGHKLDCGSCQPPQVCSLGFDGEGGHPEVVAPNTCCTPTTCEAHFWKCGDPPDGCGGTLHCGACGCDPCFGPMECFSYTCYSEDHCPPTCMSLEAAYQAKSCGQIPYPFCDVPPQDCGACAPPQKCGGGTPNICGP